MPELVKFIFLVATKTNANCNELNIIFQNKNKNKKRKNSDNNNNNTNSNRNSAAKRLSFESQSKKRNEEPTHALVFWTKDEKFSVVKYSSIQSECIQGFIIILI